jgi:hypothetical protein
MPRSVRLMTLAVLCLVPQSRANTVGTAVPLQFLRLETHEHTKRVRFNRRCNIPLWKYKDANGPQHKRHARI